MTNTAEVQMKPVSELIASMKAAADNATQGIWCTDSGGGIVADAGLNGNFYVANCSGPEHRSNARFIAATCPEYALALIAALEQAQEDSEELTRFKEVMTLASQAVKDGSPLDLESLFKGELASAMFATMFAGEFVRHGAKNYLELLYAIPEFGDFTVTIQRKDGKTPCERIAELESDEVRQCLANVEHQLHMAELAKHNLKASRRAQFRKRLAAERRASELESSLIAPGIMRCAKCAFVLTKNSINMAAGTITAGDSKTEPCPNGCGPLRPVTWKEQALDMRDSSEQWFEDLQAANKRIAELEASKLSVKLPDDLGGIINRFKYEAGHLTGWHHIDEHSCKVNRRDLMTATDLLEAIRATGIALDTGE